MLFKHLKTGGIYEFVGLTVIERTGEAAVLYRPFQSDNLMWVRPAKEFFDRYVPYLFYGQAMTAEELEREDDELPGETPVDEPDQTIGEALEIIHNRRKQ